MFSNKQRDFDDWIPMHLGHLLPLLHFPARIDCAQGSNCNAVALADVRSSIAPFGCGPLLHNPIRLHSNFPLLANLADEALRC